MVFSIGQTANFQESIIMNLMSWNVRGINRVEMHPEIRSNIAQLNLNFLALVETRVRKGNITSIRNAIILRDWFNFNNFLHCSTARIWICWKNNFLVTILDSSDQFVQCRIQIGDKLLFLTVSNGDNQAIEK